MIELSLERIAEITGGRLDHVDDPQATVTGFVEFDSRKITPGSLFVALPGAHVDGHDFARTAHERGAVATLAARSVGVPAIIVPTVGQAQGARSNADIYAHDSDGSAHAVLTAMAKLARAVVDELSSQGELTVVGVTGSAGKTSTKDVLASILATAGTTVAPPGSFNNEIGHPYTALRCDRDTKFLVTELSARGIGHIAHLTDIAPPRIGAVLNVGSAHLGEFGSKDNIAQAKGELIEALPTAADGGVAVLNADDDVVAAMAPRTQAKVVTYSADPARYLDPQRKIDYYASDISLDDVARASFVLHSPNHEPLDVKLQVFGIHQVSNALSAAVIGIEAGLSPRQVVAAIDGHRNASAHRMDVVTREDNVTVINDSYNANPESMKAGIAALAYTAAAHSGSRSIAVLGEMGELGHDAIAEHQQLGDQLAKYSIDYLIAVGDSPNTAALASQAAQKGINTHVVIESEEAARRVEEIVRGPSSRDVVLIKASNALRLWHVAEQLLTDEKRPTR